MKRRHNRIPNRLRRFRRIAGLTQTEVAKKLGMVGTDRISLWEKGIAMPNSKNLLKLSLLYRVRPVELYIDYLPILQNELGILADTDSPNEYFNPFDEFT
jgi:transcriptional regulator with XRE-family HTH domain